MPESTRVIPLGGLGEVGKNLTVIESDGGIVVVDAGLSFPRDEHLGVDLVLPDFEYLREHRHDVRAVVLTHGHEDHVGALPYLMREIEVPEVWATRLTLGLIKSKLDEHGLMRSAELVEIEPDKGAAQIGPYQVEFVRMAHSIPDAVALAFDTPGGLWSSRATTRSTTRRSTGSAPTSASSRSWATAESTCSSATPRTPSGRA